MEKNYITESLMNSINHFLEYRRIESYFYEKHFKHDIHGEAHVNNDEIIGNLATCSMLKSKQVIANSIIAPSYRIANEMRSYHRNEWLDGNELHSNIVSMLGTSAPSEKNPRLTLDDKIWFNDACNQNNVSIVDITLPGTDVNRVHDSERLILNILNDCLIKDKYYFDMVILVSERIPCESCTNIIIEFLKKNKIELILGYCYASGKGKSSRTAENFLYEVAQHSDISHLLSFYNISGFEGGCINLVQVKL